jgi:hypothetical protein
VFNAATLQLERFEEALKNTTAVILQRQLKLNHNYEVSGHCTKSLQKINKSLKPILLNVKYLFYLKE